MKMVEQKDNILNVSSLNKAKVGVQNESVWMTTTERIVF